jgi:phenylacetate-coenzyme A ligase PaaK-like adenylate-forming protein
VDPRRSNALTAEQLRELQLERLNTTLSHARANSRFYHSHLDLYASSGLSSLEELSQLPLLDASVFEQGMEALLCVSPAEVSRIVTLPTSGTTGAPKRVAFTAVDQQATLDYFAAGMRMLAKAGETVAVLFPCNSSGGLGKLLLRACEQAQIAPLAIGIPTSFASLATCFQREQVRGVVGFPQHIFAFARWCEYHKRELGLTGVLLSADNVARSMREEIARIGNCEVFEHFGMTESGYGCAVDCPCHEGLHVRESDLIIEIIDPVTGAACEADEWGELVITTLGRQALPLIRYRTGDYSRLVPGFCSCGSILRRIEAVRPRAAEWVTVGDEAGSRTLAMADLEELFFALPGVLDFKAEYDKRAQGLAMTLQVLPEMAAETQQALQRLRASHPLFSSAGKIEVNVECANDFSPYYSAKRTILSRT